MHRLTMEYDGNVIKPEFEWYNNYSFKPEYNVVINEEIQPFEKRYITEICTLPTSKDCYGIIHDDIHVHNFFVDNGNIKLFDFDDCYFGWYAGDIASALLHMVQFGAGYEKEKERTEFAEHYIFIYLKGYTQTNNISEYWIDKFDLFMRFRMTSIYKFVLNTWRNELVHPHQEYLDWHKNRIINDMSYVFIDYEKIRRERFPRRSAYT